MDFKKIVGKQVVWAGVFLDKETGFHTEYILFSDNTCFMVPDAESGEGSAFLEDPLGALEVVVSERIDEAISIMELSAILTAKKVVAPTPPGESDVPF